MKRIFTFCFFALLYTCAFAQDFTFSQFYEKPLLRNPALAGIFSGDIRVSAAHRSQWGSVTVPFKTTALSIENKIPIGNADDLITVAVQMSSDIAGDVKLKRTLVLPAINYHKSLNDGKDSYLSLAFMAGVAGSQFDPTLMKLADQFRNGSYNPSNTTSQRVERNGYNYWDASTGLSFSSSFGTVTYYVGAALYHFNKPKVGFNANSFDVHIDQRYTANAGFNMRISDYNKIMAFADYIRQGGSRQLLGGFMYGHDLTQYYEDDNTTTLYLGSFVRVGDAVIPMIKVDKKNLSMGLSYDVNISTLHAASNWRGGFELTLVYKGYLRTTSTTLDKVRCVRF
jgi:type IX secretion system PorP/SprF family membrane protein